MPVRVHLAPLDRAGLRLAQTTVTAQHYLHTPVDARCSVAGYAVFVAQFSEPVGFLLVGRPEATRCYPWYGSVADVATGRAEDPPALTRWQTDCILFQILFQQGGSAMDQTAHDAPFAEWGIVEVMGHRRLAGRLTEAVIAGATLLRVDVPAPDGTFTTQYYGGGSIYCLTPTAEAVARSVAARLQPEPVHRWELPQLQGAAVEEAAADDATNLPF